MSGRVEKKDLAHVVSQRLQRDEESVEEILRVQGHERLTFSEGNTRLGLRS